MKIEEVRNLELVLAENKFHKYTTALTSTETFGYFKAFKSASDPDDILYQIEVRFWDFRKYNDMNPEYAFGVDVCVMVLDHYNNIEMTWSEDAYDVTRIETNAFDFYNFVQKHLSHE